MMFYRIFSVLCNMRFTVENVIFDLIKVVAVVVQCNYYLLNSFFWI